MTFKTDPRKKPLKITHIVLSKGFAGSERSTAESCNAQCINHDVSVIIRKKHRKNGKSIVDHLDPRVKIFTAPSFSLLTFLKIKQLIKNINPDVIHCHLRRATRYVARINPPAATASTLHITVNGKHFLDMDGLICNARWHFNDIPSNYKGITFKANNSLTPHRRLEASEIQKLRESLGIQPDELLIGAVGRLHPSKAWDTLIHAFNKVITDKPVKLVFLGEGSQESELKSLAKDNANIIWAGFKNNVKDYYQCFDLLICPSRFEPLPRVMLEAYDAGTPIIASDIGGCLELVEDYGGETFKVDNIDDLRDKLTKAIENPPKKHRPDLSAHHIENASQAMLDFYYELIANKKAK